MFRRISEFDYHVATCSANVATWSANEPLQTLEADSFPSFIQSEQQWENSSDIDDLGVRRFESSIDNDGFESSLEISTQIEDSFGVSSLGQSTSCMDSDLDGSSLINDQNTGLEDCSMEGLDNDVDPICVVPPDDFPDEHQATNETNEPNETIECDHNEDVVLTEDEYRDLFCDGVLSDLIKIKNRSDKLFSRLYAAFGARLPDDDNLQNWLAKSLGMRSRRFKERLKKWLTPNNGLRRGRPKITPEIAQKIFDLWVVNSTISVDRRDGRDLVRIPMKDYQKRYQGIECSLVKSYTNKRNIEMAQAPRYICHKTVREMVEIIEEKICKQSRGSVPNFRPFFVLTPTEREKLECLCTVCCNARSVFNPIQRAAKKRGFKQYTSITSYLTGGNQCKQDRNGYLSKSCILGECQDCHGIINPEKYSFLDSDVVTYYLFETHPTGQLDKKGKPKKKTKRVDYNSVPAMSVVNKLNEFATRYLLHRYDFKNDQVIWPLIQEKCDERNEYIAHMDYSENLKEKPKFETQPHHYSGEQHSLHCSVVQTPNGNLYFYHFSDEKSHDWKFTKAVIIRLVKEIFGEEVIVRIKTDNCTVQYKCSNVFGMYSEISVDTGKTIIVYYGAAGHGRGLVDGMSSWGVKTPLRKHIILADWYWHTASKLVEMFTERGFSSDTRHYAEITIDEVNNFPTVNQRPIAGSSKLHMMAYFPDGTISGREDICECDMCIIGKFSECEFSDEGENITDIVSNHKEVENDDTEDDSNGDDEDDDEDDGDVQFDLLCEIVQPGQIIALRTDPIEQQSFYLVEVNEVIKEADADTFDAFNHFVVKGSKYLSCHYLEIDERGTPKNKKFIQYKKCSSKVLVLAGEVLSPFVNIPEDLKLSNDEKQWLDDMA